ncbi:MAG: radical SAM family heme chaperone HemW [Arcanobacterium sp.]|nr:radical SAM family heme chaperone HemW [Arcanobacterium sp.]
MPELPEGVPLPLDGALPNPDVSKGFSAYVHIPFCAVRCGYCDFNTYANLDFGPNAGVKDFEQSLFSEIEFAARVLGVVSEQSLKPQLPLLNTVFFGGGTPTMLQAEQLVAVLQRLQATFGIKSDAEVSTEANPETVTQESLAALQAGGFNRISFGMQSAVPEVLATLERSHTPGQVRRVVEWAKELALNFSLDLIYGAPGETMEQWKASLEAAISLSPEHISAYGLTIEPGTKMGAQLQRGEISEPDPDELADKYLLAEEMLTAAGYQNYEISNWARPGRESQHNRAYWQNQNWWGFGPGAHSHFNGTRFWNVKHPLAYAKRVFAGQTPAQGSEELTLAEQREEQIMLGIRLREGIRIPNHVSARTLTNLVQDGLIEKTALQRGNIVLTLRGRLLADTVIRELW